MKTVTQSPRYVTSLSVTAAAWHDDQKIKENTKDVMMFNIQNECKPAEWQSSMTEEVNQSSVDAKLKELTKQSVWFNNVIQFNITNFLHSDLYFCTALNNQFGTSLNSPLVIMSE